MDNVTIEYQFTFTNHEFLKIPLILNPESMELNIDITSNNDHSKWAKLDFNKCKHCPLNNDSHPDCPLASKLLPVVELFAHIISTDTVDLKVITPFRTISENTQAQSAISSLIGIIMATSGCPYTAFFKPMARFHLPLAEIEETVFRATSMYMLAQYYRHKKGKTASFDMDGLVEIYENMQLVNQGLAKRIKATSKEDSSVNAIVILDMFAQNLSLLIDEALEDIEHLFKPFFTD